MMNAPDCGTGFFGKVRSHGDFVTRRLPVSFIRPWDNWLQTALQASREELGHAWLNTYLNSPIWRFVLAPGACSAQAWAGVLMPSVDKVGRYFPLTIAASVSGTAFLLECITKTGAWYAQLETLALSALRDDFKLDAFDATLSMMVAQPGETGIASMNGLNVVPQGHVLPLKNLGQLKDTITQLSQTITAASLDGRSVWWTEGSQQIAPSVLVHKGLPTAKSFSALLDGQWRAHGWHDGGVVNSSTSTAA